MAIAVFDDRIEVHSVGDFPTGIDAEKLLGEHKSVQRNPLMAGAFHRTGAVEVWGRGTNRVIAACKAWGIAPPEYQLDSGVVTVTFRVAVLPGNKVPITIHAENAPENAPENAGERPEKTPQAILSLLRKQPELSFPQMAAKLNKSESAIKRAIRKLRESGRLQRIGPAKGGHWQVLDN